MKSTLNAVVAILSLTMAANGAYARGTDRSDRTDRTSQTRYNSNATVKNTNQARYNNEGHYTDSDARYSDGRMANRAWYEGNSKRIYNAVQDTNLTGDTARGSGTVGMSNMGGGYIEHGRTMNGEQTSAMVVKH